MTTSQIVGPFVGLSFAQIIADINAWQLTVTPTSAQYWGWHHDGCIDLTAFHGAT